MGSVRTDAGSADRTSGAGADGKRGVTESGGLDCALQQQGMFRHPAPGCDPRRVLGKPHEDRARQFVPFMALKGYHQLVRQQEAQPEPRLPRSDLDLRRLSEQLQQLERGQLVRVTYYARDHYAHLCDRVRQVDSTLRMLRLECAAVPFDQIDQILTSSD